MKHYRVILTAAERAALEDRLARGSNSSRSLTHARILLKADQGPLGPAWTDAAIAAALDVHRSTVERVRRRSCQADVSTALRARRPVPQSPGRLDGVAEAHLVTLACSTPPEGSARWSLRLLARRLVELDVVERVSYETVRRTLKKTRSNPG